MQSTNDNQNNWLALVKVEQPITVTITELAGNYARATALVGEHAVPCFIPGSGIHKKRVKAETIINVGDKVDGLITSIDQKRRNVVVDIKNGLRDRFLSGKKPGDEMEGVVTAALPFGHFIDFGPVDALLHVGDVPAGTSVSVGQRIKVRYLSLSNKGLKVTLKEPAAIAHVKPEGNDGKSDGGTGDGSRENAGAPGNRRRQPKNHGGREFGKRERGKKPALSAGRRRRHAEGNEGDDSVRREHRRASTGPARHFTWLTIAAADGTLADPTMASIWPK